MTITVTVFQAWVAVMSSFILGLVIDHRAWRKITRQIEQLKQIQRRLDEEQQKSEELRRKIDRIPSGRIHYN
jgi:uncharacterized membrane-anchored protein YhcB (DUF1043 family)